MPGSPANRRHRRDDPDSLRNQVRGLNAFGHLFIPHWGLIVLGGLALFAIAPFAGYLFGSMFEDTYGDSSSHALAWAFEAIWLAIYVPGVIWIVSKIVVSRRRRRANLARIQAEMKAKAQARKAHRAEIARNARQSLDNARQKPAAQAAKQLGRKFLRDFRSGYRQGRDAGPQ